MKYFPILLTIVSLSSCSFAGDVSQRVEKMAAACERKYPDIDHISVTDYLKQKKLWVLVDVRTDRERAVSTLQGAMDLKSFEKEYAYYKKSNILFFCTIGERSSIEAMKHKGKYPRVANLRGGILAWAGQGLSFVTVDGKTTRTVHVYGKRWNLLPKTYKGVW